MELKSKAVKKGYKLTHPDTTLTFYGLYDEFQPVIAERLKEEQRKEVEDMRFKFSERTPAIGDRCIIYQGLGKPVYFGYRSSQNWYNSGEWKIRVDTEGLKVVTIERIKNGT